MLHILVGSQCGQSFCSPSNMCSIIIYIFLCYDRDTIKRYISESGRILPSRVTSVSLNKQKELSRSIKRARLLALL